MRGPDAFDKEKFLDTPIGFARANSISDVPHDLGLAFGRTTFKTLVFFGGAAFEGVARLYMAFIRLATSFLDTSAFCFLIAVWEASVPGSGRGP
jgi:hypothetical protein